MYSSYICVSPCRCKDYVFQVGQMYFCKETINYKNELTEYIIYSEFDLGDRSVKTFIGYIKLNFLKCNFMNFGSYCLILNQVDKVFENMLWGI